MLIYYYGGTSPISRRLEGTYSLAMYAAQGYVVYTLNPSGTTGYGQEFSARDELTRRGQQKYGSMPRFDTGRNEYYWIARGHRFSFSRYAPGTIRVRLSGE